MALIIEDGSIVVGADSFATVAQFRDYAAKRGVTVPAADADVEILLIKAMDYIAAQEGRFKGYRVSDIQYLSWPRRDVYVYGVLLSYLTIPQRLVEGQLALAIAAQTIDLMPTIDPSASNIKRDKVGPLETEFFGPADGVSTQPTLTAVDALLDPLYNGGRFSLRVGRA